MTKSEGKMRFMRREITLLFNLNIEAYVIDVMCGSYFGIQGLVLIAK